MVSKEEALNALKKVNDPELHRSLVELGMVDSLTIGADGVVRFTLKLTTLACPMKHRMAEEARAVLLALPGICGVEVAYAAMSTEQIQAIAGSVKMDLPPIKQFNQIRRIVAVLSGKGGVGKSSLTAMLAVELRRQGHKVGILDADVTGPSIPKLFGLPPGGLRGGDLGMLPAITTTGIRVVSTNLLLKQADQPTIWRGPLIAGTIKQFWRDTIWGRLDYLLVDLPPGTSDAALTVMQNLPLDGVVLVTTPQELAALVVSKAVHMVERMGFPILAVVENMSYFLCPDNGKKYFIFGPSHVDAIANAAQVPVFARIPVNPEVAVLCDAGRVEEIDQPQIGELASSLAALHNGEDAARPASAAG